MRPSIAKAVAKMTYLKETEALIVELNPKLAGRLEWADLVHGYNVGRTAAETAERYVASHTEGGRSMSIKTNDLKKGDRVVLKNGWVAEIADNRKGNTRLCIVYGYYTETGSVYAWDIDRLEDGSHLIELTPRQIKDRDIIEHYFS